ncbi:zf-RVT domain-containing protein [Gossypium australe]|uniref:Zf-RVT domain-containing protein n=1 Tax=Gossypium australe TaxID=47621 RepID=A0A5B6VJS2_9ROSI|nr:zf-RVT domain-containing protein [Gossypium australe]
MAQKLHSWASKSLAFDGRLQLLPSIIFSLQNVWCTIFILPSELKDDLGSRTLQYGIKLV